MTTQPDRDRLDGTLEYDAESRWLIFTDRIGPNEYGASEIVASDVAPWWADRGLAANVLPAPDTALRAALRDLRGAVEIMDTKITPYGEREDGTTAAYIVGDSTWHRVLAIARGSVSDAARAALAAATPTPAPTLDAAWAEAEAALPVGWHVAGVYRIGPSPMMRREYEAVAWGPWDRPKRSVASESGYGPTPAAALHALATRLTAEAEGAQG